jgi:DNA-binding NarL/FixJ family response regulator
MSRQPEIDPRRRRKQILLVDWHPLMRSAVAEWINRCPDLEVCGAAGGIAQAFRAVKSRRPDLVVSEILRPHDLGFIRELHRRHPGLPILIFSIQDAALFAARTRDAGASGYLTKEAGGNELVRIIRAMLRLQQYRRATSVSRRGDSAKG